MAVSRIHIVYVIGSLQLGGAEKLVSHLASGLHDRPGFSCSVCCVGTGGEYADRLIRSGYRVHVLGHKKQGVLRGVVTGFRLVRQLRALFRRERGWIENIASDREAASRGQPPGLPLRRPASP